MRLLIDEHYSNLIAQRLTDAGYDVTAVTLQGLRGETDQHLLEVAVDQQRALLTNDVRHFIPLVREWSARGRDHFGLIPTSDDSMPRSKRTVGLYVTAIRALMDTSPAATALLNRVVWLK